MEETLKKLQKEALEKISKMKSIQDLKDLEVAYLGRNGELTGILKGIKDLSIEEKKTVGRLSNEVKTSLTEAFKNAQKVLEKAKIDDELNNTFFDTTIPAKARGVGHVHLISKAQEDIEKIFMQMGFMVADGPEIESEYYNFESLNIPADHPARDMQDTFFIKDKEDKDQGRMVLRTHTSPVQVRSIEKYGAPLRLIVPGRVFRYEAVDASHDTTFYQIEGLLIGEEASLSTLKGIMAEMLSRLFGKKVVVRLRPGYFPFVEPGLELDFSCLICNGDGCSVCKQSGWVECMGAGMVHENVLKYAGLDPNKYHGWAFGFGLTRLVMMKYGIDDIRLLTNGDLRFIKQF